MKNNTFLTTEYLRCLWLNQGTGVLKTSVNITGSTASFPPLIMELITLAKLFEMCMPYTWCIAQRLV